jgi:hypothetical protein
MSDIECHKYLREIEKFLDDEKKCFLVKEKFD